MRLSFNSMGLEKPREIAARVLKVHASGRDYLETLMEDEFRKTNLSAADRGLAQELAYGVTRWKATLDWLIRRRTEGRHQRPMVEILLRLGLYQMFWLDRVPDHAAVFETVELAKAFDQRSKAAFVNAVLRGYAREQDETRRLLAELKKTDPASGYSHPEWLCNRWQLRWDQKRAEKLLDWNNTPPKTFARLNTLVASDLLCDLWTQEGVRFIKRQWDWTGPNLVFELESHPPLATLESHRRGWFYIQDPSTLLAVRELDPQPGDTVLDLCSAPGGKTTYIAQLMRNQGRVVAQDASRARLDLVKENCARLSVRCVEMSVATTVTIPELSVSFDRILVDAPCSNTGAMRRRVDVRWRIRPQEIARLQTLQLELLANAAVQLKPGGVLVYSTCSLEPEENHDVVENFIAHDPTMRLESERQLLPFEDHVDGAYVARLIRDSSKLPASTKREASGRSAERGAKIPVR